MKVKKDKKLNEAAKDLGGQIKGGNPVDDTAIAHQVVTPDDANEDAGISSPKKTSPQMRDEQAFGGDTAALTSDDDIDEVGEDYGVQYKDEEELDVSKKINMQTKLGLPEEREEESP